MKKETGLKILLSILTAFFILSIVSSALVLADDTATGNIDASQLQENSKEAGKALIAPFIGMAQGVLEVIFGKEWAIGTRGLFFVLLFLLIWTVVPYMFPASGKLMTGTISFIVAILAAMAIPPEFIDVILVQYGAMGATMLTVLPFLIILTWSIMTKSAFGARVIWIFYAFYYLGMYFYKAVQGVTTGTAGTSNLLYFGAFIIGIFMFFVIKGARDLIFHGELDALKEKGDQRIKKAKAGQDMLIHTADTLGNE